ncbi:MAG: ATP-binding protein [Tardiphaga sp.]
MDGAGKSFDHIFPGTSDLSQLMRAHDWDSHALGSPLHWPDGLKVPLGMMLTSRFEMWLGWGPDIAFFYNDAYVPTLGTKHPRSMGLPMRDVWTEVFAEVEDRIRSVMADGVATWDKALLLLLERNGYPEETYHTFSYSPLRGDSGRIEGLMCVVSEETERVIGERQLSMLHMLADGLTGVQTREAAVGAVCDALAADRKDFPFGLIYLQDAAHGWTGYACTPDAEALLSRDWPLPAILDGAAEIRIDLASDDDGVPSGAWRTKPKQALLVPIARAGDKPLGVLVLGLNPHRLKDESILGFAQLIAAQISGALGNINALTSERRRADRIWLNSRDLIVVIDRDGIFRSVSPSWARIFGHDINAVVGRSFLDFVHPDDAAMTRGGIDASLEAGSVDLFENRYLDQAGEPHWISWNSSVENDLIYAYGRDITAEKAQGAALAEAEAQLRQAQKMEAVGQLTGGIAHDFNNMLAVVIGSLELLERRGEQSPRSQRYIAAAMDGARRSASLTQRLLAFSRRQPLKPESLDANKLVADTSELLRRSIGANIRLETVLAGGLWRVHADPNQLVSVLLNLAVNARDAMPVDGRLTIETQNSHLDENYAAANFGVVPGQYVLIAVSDTGHGMPDDVIAKAFDPFFTTKEVGKGTGLGLSQVYGFIKQSNGHVKIYSEPGQGTAVKVYLPRLFATEPEPADLKALPPATENRGNEIILVVEDEAAVRQFSVDALGMLGYRILEADGAANALALLRMHPDIAMMFTDVIMPEVNGARLAEQARKLRPDLRVLFTTGYTRNAVVHNGVLDPGVDLLGKPFSIDQLAMKVREVLDR